MEDECLPSLRDTYTPGRRSHPIDFVIALNILDVLIIHTVCYALVLPILLALGLI